MVAAVRRHSGLVLIGLSLCAAYFHVALDFKHKWDLPQSYYSHGYLVVPITLWLIYRMREDLGRMATRPANVGLFLLVAGCLIRMLGAFSSINVLSGISLIVVLLGLALMLGGWKITWKLMFPLLFLVVMVPAPTQLINKVSFWMKMLATDSTVVILNNFSAGIVQSGSKMQFMRDGSLEFLVVGDVCSGLRSLIALIAFGALFAYLTEVSLWKRLTLFAASIPAAFIANLARILIISLVALTQGSVVAVKINYLHKLGLESIVGEWGTLHDITGIIVYFVAFFVLFTIEKLLRRIGRKPEPATEDAT